MCFEWLTTSTGVSQGSVLGPLLISLIINDIASSHHYSQHMIFADDTQIYLFCLPSGLETGLSRVAHDGWAIAAYAKDNGLKLNLSKIEIFIRGSIAHISHIKFDSLSPITIDGTSLLLVREGRNL